MPTPCPVPLVSDALVVAASALGPLVAGETRVIDREVLDDIREVFAEGRYR